MAEINSQYGQNGGEPVKESYQTFNSRREIENLETVQRLRDNGKPPWGMRQRAAMEHKLWSD